MPTKQPLRFLASGPAVRQEAGGGGTTRPTGAYFKGGTYGTDVTLTPSFAEFNNTAYKGCTDRNPLIAYHQRAALTRGLFLSLMLSAARRPW